MTQKFTAPGDSFLLPDLLPTKWRHPRSNLFETSIAGDLDTCGDARGRGQVVECIGQHWNRNELFLTYATLRGIQAGRKENPEAVRIRGAVKVRSRDGEGYGRSA